jgi:hypothetical protein
MATASILFPQFLIGANLPWVHYGIDFGSNAWTPDGGIGRPGGLTNFQRTSGSNDNGRTIDAEFTRLAAEGVQTLRWFLFCDGRAGINFSAGGRPQGLDDFVFRDIDTALTLAQRHGLRIMFVLVDFHWCKPARVVKGVQIGGRSHVLSDSDCCDALIETAFRPVLERYARESAVFAWDIINEPEWITSLTPDQLRRFLSNAISVVRSCTNHQVTIGSAGVRWRDFYKDLDLDVYQVHWYDTLRHQPPLHTPVAEMAFDKPVLLGEFPARDSTRTPADVVETARTAGYAGAFYWSVLA